MLRALLVLVAAAVVVGCGGAGDRQARQLLADLDRPNFVLVLTDDLSMDMLAFMPNTTQLAGEGMLFERFVVSNSLCCPSRASLLTGQLPHNTGVFTNSPPRGGNAIFNRNGNADRTLAVTLRDRGYRTALFGKYLNGYGAGNGGVPPGWTDWAATARAYQGFDYTLNIDGAPRQFGSAPEDYMTDVLADRGDDFLGAALTDRRPFFLKLSTFTPHLPAVPAPRHIGLVPNLRAPRSPSFNRPNRQAPQWLANRKRINRQGLNLIDARYRNRVRSVISIDELVGRIRRRVAELGLTDRTYFVFASDNGFHMGEHQLLPGKGTAFDSDIRVPLIAAGPDIPAGTRVDALVQNTDLAPTFEELAGATARPEIDGRSLAGLLRGEAVPADWRPAAFVEHRGREGGDKLRDPDDQPRAAGNPPSYNALRFADSTYVEYSTGEREFYDLVADPHQRFNIFRDLDGSQRRALSNALDVMITCRGSAQCATATPPVRRAARAAAARRRSAPRR